MQSLTAPHSVEPATRICTKCAEEKTLDEFYHSWCRVCWYAYLALRRKKKRKKQLRSEFFAIGRSRNLKECEKLSTALISRFGGLDCVSRELLDVLRGMEKDCPSSFKYLTSVWVLMDFAEKAKAKRDEEFDEAVGQLDGDEIIEAAIEPMLAEMCVNGELVPILKRLVQQGKLKVEDLK